MDISVTEKVLSHIPSRNNRLLWNVVLVGAAIFAGAAAVAFGVKGFFLALAAICAALLFSAIFWKPWIGVAAIAFTLPFERFGSIELSGFTLRISQVLLLVTLFVSLIMLVRGKLRLRWNGVHIPLLVFLLGVIVALPQSVNMFRSATTLGFMLFTISLVVLVPTVVRSKEQVIRIVQALLLGAIVTSLFGVFQFVGDLAGLPQEITGLRDLYTKEVFGFPRVQSTALEPLYFANYLLLPLAIALVTLLRRIKPLFFLSALLVPLALPVFVLTLSRGAYIAGLVLVAILSVWLFKRVLKPEYIFLVVLVGFLTFVGVTYALSLTGEGDTSIQAFTQQATGLFTGASYADRASTSFQAIELIRNNPLGIGPGNFGPAVAIHPQVEPRGGWLIVNNIYLEVLVEEGIIGFLGLASFVGFILYGLLKVQKRVEGIQRSLIIALFATLIAIGAQYLTFSILYIMHIWFALGLAIAVMTINTQRIWK